MNRRSIVVALALLCVAQVWCQPTDRNAEDDYPEDEKDDENEPADDDGVDNASSPAGPVELLTKPVALYVHRGDTVYLPCQFRNSDNVAVTWMKDSIQLYVDESKFTDNSRIDRLDNNTLVIMNVNESDSSDQYECSALEHDDAKLNTKVTHRLHVETRDESLIRVLPREFIEVEQGARLTLGCEVTGELKEKTKAIVWSRAGARLILERETPDGIYFEIYNATRHVAGEYQCLVDTGVDKPPVKHLKLRVRHLDIEYDTEQNKDGRVRNLDHYYTGIGPRIVTNITCMVHAHPAVTKLHWFKNGQRLKTDGQHLIKSDDHKNHHVLTINGTSKSDLGNYHCKAWSHMGEKAGPEIIVRDTPSEPRSMKGDSEDDAIVLPWSVISYTPIVEIELMYRKDGEENFKLAEEVKVASSIGKEHIIQGKIRDIPAGKYEARIRARNDEEHASGDANAEWGPYSELLKFDAEYKKAESVRGSAMRPTLSLMTLLLIISPFAYSCL